MFQVRGKVSWFGGPDDEGVDPDEGLAFIYDVDDQPDLFLPDQPPGTSGLARRLDAEGEYYVACRWPYDEETKPEWRELLLNRKALVRSVRTGKEVWCFPADWGPHADTNRVADVSPAVMQTLGLETDDEVEVFFDEEIAVKMPYESIVISSGHGKYVRGASGILDEVNEARRVVEQVATELRARDVNVTTYHDDVSQSQNENLNRIVDFHNAQTRDLDVSVHFNAYVETEDPMGTECLYVTQDKLAGQIASAIASCGFKNRGPKKRTDLFFLNNTDQPSILIETCFVDSEADADVYDDHFNAICEAIAQVLGGEEVEPGPEPEPEPEPEMAEVTITIDAPPTVKIIVKQTGES